MLVAADRLLTMDDERRVLTPGWLRTEGHTIVEIGEGRPQGRIGADLQAPLVTPGLVSAHQHVVDALLRGVEPGEQFLDWLLGVYYTGLSLATPADCRVATEVVMSQSLRAGITTVVDCWGLDGGDPDRARLDAAAHATLDAHRRSGARVVFALMFAEHVPAQWRTAAPWLDLRRLCAPAEHTFERVRALAEQVAAPSDGRLRVTPMPELPELVSDSAFRRAGELASELGVVLPVHLCASPTSRDHCGPDELDALGLLGPGLLGVHCIAVDDTDVQVLAAAGVGIAHCPTANQRFPGGTTPVAAFRSTGAHVGVGLDNATLNPDVDLLAEARAAIVAVERGGGVLTSEQAYAMATRDAARAIGLGDQIGSLEVGRRADLVLYDIGGAHWVPDDDPYEALVWRATTADVHTVVVDGAVVVRDGRCVTLDPDLEEFARASRRLRSAVAVARRSGLGNLDDASVTS
jgi:5-methylthioadenosine/S-adenosylhomocysteine deaminase